VILLRELESLRKAGGSIGPDHPRFKKWQTGARLQLERCGDESLLREYKRLSFNRQARKELSDPKETRAFLEDLGKAVALLGQIMPEPPDRTNGVQHATDLGETGVADLILPSSTSRTDLTERGSMPGDPREEPTSHLRSQYFSSESRSKAIEGVIARLDKELRSDSGDWTTIQEVMEEMAALKRCDDLLLRLDEATASQDARWEAVRCLLAELWSVRKSMVLDLLPTLLAT
jgi:hypothetical protein